MWSSLEEQFIIHELSLYHKCHPNKLVFFRTCGKRDRVRKTGRERRMKREKESDREGERENQTDGQRDWERRRKWVRD